MEVKIIARHKLTKQLKEFTGRYSKELGIVFYCIPSQYEVIEKIF